MDRAPEPITSISVIVIEDSEDDYRRLLDWLRASDMHVDATRVQNSEGLREALKGEGYDAVISSHQLPEFSSLDALKQVRGVDPDLPFLVVSSATGEETAVEAMRAGVDDYLLKAKLHGLLPALDRALKSAADRRRWRGASAALKESETRFSALTANLPGLVFQMEYSAGNLILLYASEGSYRMLGLTPDDLLAQPSLFFDFMAPADAAELWALLTDTVTTVPFLAWEAALDERPGEEARWIEVSARSRRLSSSAVLWDGIVTDVSAAKKVQLEARELGSHLTRVREEERESIARELHDDVGSTLSAVKFELAWLKNAARSTPSIADKLAEVDRLVDAAIMSSSRITQDLRPGIIDEGLVASLEWQARAFERRMGIPCSFWSSHEDLALDHDPSLAMFRVCQEALNNIAKHAHATRVDVSFTATEDALVLEIHDNGTGIASADTVKRTSFGLRGMKERAHSVGGEIEIRGGADGGTTITFLLSRVQPRRPSHLHHLHMSEQ